MQEVPSTMTQLRDQTSTVQELIFKLKGQKTYSMKLYQKIYSDLGKQFIKIK